MSKDTRYAAFISYAHADEAMASRLHKALETYRVPKTLKLGHEGSLSPIFRDAAELTAHHSLSDKIQEAVHNSRFLIVLCSPAAKASHWVNEEIRLFREFHGEASILCVLSEGTPDTSFPPALLEGGREPLAANLGTSRDSFQLGVTQLAASMLGVGLDELIQRDAKRRRTRLRFLTSGSLVFAAIMGVMAWTAIDARDAAETSRTEAEKMVEFMLTDLKQDLEPVGKLDILDDVGKRVSDYYQAIPFSDMDDDRLARQARARHLLGQVALDQGKDEKAKTEIEAAYKATEEVLRQNSESTDAIFAHAQSEYWLGRLKERNRNYQDTLKHWEQYALLGQKLYETDPSNVDWVMERAWGANNVAYLHNQLNNMKLAQGSYLESIKYFEAALKIYPNHPTAKKELANAIVGASNTALKGGDFKLAKKYREKQLRLLEDIVKERPQDVNLKYRLNRSRMKLYELEAQFNASSCDIKRSNAFLGEFRNFLDYDKLNYQWQQQYISYWYRMLKTCPNIPSKEEFNKEVEKLLSHLDETLTKEDQKKERAKIMLLRQ